LGHHEDKVIIVCVMFFIPTLALCNAVKDMLNSDIITGLYRFTEALLITTAMTTGFFFARVFMGDLRDAVPGIQMNAIHFSVQILLAALGTLGFSDFFGIERRRLLQATIGGIIAWSVFLLIDHLNGGLFFCNAGAALVIGFWSEFAARRWKAPSNIFLIPAVIPLLPGALLYRTLNGIITGSASQAYTAGTDLALTVAGIEIGFLTAFVFTYWAIGFFREAAHNISALSKARRIRKIRRKK
ncbi:threonine/serine exporter family protein, partial [Eubacterium pyruvativorans]|uniref:threonine/serine exporter family protein n=1 Tax=Eubacterium pyruvativorans TaxID=155865 RepID=UPI0013D750B0